MSAGSLVMPRPRPPLERVPPVSNARLAILVIIVAESMLFAGLIGMYLVFRLSATWPPPGLPRLPLAVTALNTVVLLASVVPLSRAMRAEGDAMARGLAATTALGATFLAVQGFEWARLVQHGLTLRSGTYGATFYVLIGCHAVHVLVAVVWLAIVALLARRGAFAGRRRGALEMCSLYWYFVCALWAVLFPLVYLY
jgi:heme/copper-type cytochrome/quinol oxidase subunit 3